MSFTDWLLTPTAIRPGELQLVEELGPKARRRAVIATVVTIAVIVGALGWGVYRFNQRKQFAPELWRPFRLWASWRFLLLGLGNTLKAAGLATVLALFIGLVMAVWRSTRGPGRGRDVFAGVTLFIGLLMGIPAWISGGKQALSVVGGVVIGAIVLRQVHIRSKRTFAALYVEGFRACALVLLISTGFIFYPRVWPDQRLSTYAYVSLVSGLTLYYSTVLAEVIRSGIRSIPNGQTEAALTVGLSEGRAMRLIVLPQAIRRALPNIITQVASLLKDTSLGVFVTYDELTKRAQITGEFNSNNLQSFIVAGGLYIALIAFITFLANRLRDRQTRRA